MTTPNKSQARAIERFRQYMTTQLNSNPEYGDTLVTFEVEADRGRFWITAKTDMVKLGENNLLRFLDQQYWFVSVGKRGALDVRMCPKSYYQFKGTRALGMNFQAG